MPLKLSTAPLFQIFVLCFLVTSVIAKAAAQPNINGETGYINMPSGRIESDGTFRMGYSVAEPYATIWASIAFLPRVEFNARYTRIMTGESWTNNPAWKGYGDYKDKVVSGKVILMKEDWITPSLAMGLNDVQGTGLFKSKYLAASKQLGGMDATLGIGDGRISGVFAGARYAPDKWRGLALVAEYDANDYPHDPFSSKTNIAQRGKGLGLALEYRWGWLGSQLSYRDSQPGINLFASIPLESKEFIPKIDEPPVDTEIVTRPTLEQWNADSQYRQKLTVKLIEQDFKNVHINVSEQASEVTLTNTRISLASRAAGRAARSMVLHSPEETQEIRIHYTINDMPFATYTFADTGKLRRYFNGQESRKQLAPSVTIDYAEPQQAASEAKMHEDMLGDYANTRLDSNDGDIVSFRSESARLDKIRVAPGLGFYFNDPSGAFRYETFINASYGKQVVNSLFLKTSAQLTLLQDVSGVSQPSNSLLPHVRTDVADYKKSGNIKLTQALLNKFYHPKKRIYARASAGLYEEMFGGAGGQVLFFPEKAPWAFDVSMDVLRQRDVGGGLTFRDYSTVTALATLHYRFQTADVTAAVRLGRFLAGDSGTRFEVKRRFRSRFEIGVWYSLTNGNDITGPGSPARPYYDKGVFMSIPLSSMLTRDTQANPRIAISPWTRDVGQMVFSPGDLYDMLEPAYINMHDHDGLQYLGDMDDSYN